MTTYADTTDKTVDTWKQGVRAVSDRMEFLVTLPSLDLVQPVERYFDYLQRAVDLNRELTTRWAELVTRLSGSLREETLRAGQALEEQVEGAADKAGELALKGKELADRTVDEAKGKAKQFTDDAVGTVKHLTDEAADTAEDLADDAAETTSKATTRTRRR
jgi:hypothetical protein